MAELQNLHRNMIVDLLAHLIQERGAIVTSADCSEMEITFARSEGRFYVDGTGLGYVVRLRKWRENAEAALEDVADLKRSEKSTFEEAVED